MWLQRILILILILVIGFVFYWSCCQINPLTSVDYALICQNDTEYDALLIKMSRLEGMVTVMQRTIPVYGGLIIAVILFLTWKQQNIAKSTAIEEINDNFKTYKDRIEELESQASDLVEGIKAKHNTLLGLGELKVNDIVKHYSKIN